MFVSNVNDVKIYNLSSGKSIPEWLSDRKKKSLYSKNVDLRRHIELIQDFEMPGVATSISCSPDNQYILATGTYKPRVRCYEFNNLSIKFERCFDSEVEKFVILSEDYSKLAFLSCDRHIEFHTASGGLYKLRIPRFGRDLAYHTPSCDLLVVAASTDLYRLNLERGQFLQPFSTDFPNNCLDINPEHYLISVGNEKGSVESFDHRMRRRCAVLDVREGAAEAGTPDMQISSVNFKDGLTMAVGTSSGQVLLYDIRSKKPLLIKDHMNNVPIKKVQFNKAEKCVYSMDGGILKVWDELSGKQVAYIESSTEFNDFCTIPNSGMLFFAQEDVKMMTYYIPSLGPAPRWCSFLDNFIEDIESENVQTIYDDYKFVTKEELIDMGLGDLDGTNLLRSYMHGYFMDIRLYNKMKKSSGFSVEKYKNEKIQKIIEERVPNRVDVKASDLPTYNQKIASHYLSTDFKAKKNQPNLLQDDRFKTMFEDPDFIVDESTDDFKLVRPVLSRLNNEVSKKKKMQARFEANFMMEEETRKKEGESDEELIFSAEESEANDDSSSEDERMTKALKRQHKILKKQKQKQNRLDEKKAQEEEDNLNSKVKKIDIDDHQNNDSGDMSRRIARLPLNKRIQQESGHTRLSAHKMEFKVKDPRSAQMKKQMLQNKAHRFERSKIARTK